MRKKKKHKGLKITLIVLFCLILAGFGSLAFYLYRQANSGLFFEDTKINDYDVSGKTCKEVLLMMQKDYSAPTLTLQEKKKDALVLSLADMGYQVDEMKLLSNLQECMTQQNMSLFFSLVDGNIFEVDVPFVYDEEAFNASVSQKNLAEERKASTDASLEYNGTEYYIEPETYGNEMDDADLRALVKDHAEFMISGSRPSASVYVEIPESFYFQPSVKKDDEEMNYLMNIYNSFCKAKITYTFGEEEKVLDWSTIQDWIIINDDEIILDDEDVYNYVYDLAYNYDTLYYARDFEGEGGRIIHYESSDYGYQIDTDAEAQTLMADINNNTAVEREPIYAVRGYKRKGYDDVCGNYVEADLTLQHLWFYRDGELIVESDFVSGLPRDGRETITGAFGIPYKKSPETLKGNGWETKVTFWMPFNDGQGLHDAPWRGSFGGNIYQSNGSHGCINLPYDVASTIYANMEERIPIFVHK